MTAEAALRKSSRQGDELEKKLSEAKVKFEFHRYEAKRRSPTRQRREEAAAARVQSAGCGARLEAHDGVPRQAPQQV